MEGGTKVSSLTWNELLDAGNWYARKHEHLSQLPN